MKHKIMMLMVGVFLLIGCDRHPFKRTSTLADEGLLPGIHSEFIIYDEGLKTGGNLFVYPGGENQTVDLAWRDRPYSGQKCIKYTWNGGDVTDTNAGIQRHDFVGLDLVVSDDADDFDTVQAKDLSVGGYTKISFYVRGALSSDTTVKVEAIDDGDSTTNSFNATYITVTDAWQRHEITIPAARLAAVKEFFKITFIYTQPAGSTTSGSGGGVFIDDIKLEQ